MRIVSYYVAYGETHDEFTQSVNRAINEGWVPQGGVSVSHLKLREDGDIHIELLQAMVKHVED
jgi:hypothetical protein